MHAPTIDGTACCPLVYIGWKPATSRTVRALEPIAGEPLIGRLVDRLARAFDCPVTIVCHDDGLADGLASFLDRRAAVPGGRSDARFMSTAVALIGALEELAVAQPHVRHLAVFTEDAPFPDCLTARRMIDAHLASGADATCAATLPIGLLPLLFRTERLGAFRTLDARSWPDPVVRVLEALVTWREEPTGPRVSTFAEPSLATSALPNRVLVTDARTRDAATRAAQMDGVHLDATPARTFKRMLTPELLRRVPISRSRSASSTAVARVLFSSLRDGFTGAEESLWLLMRGLRGDGYEPVALLQSECVLAERLRVAGIAVTIADFDLRELGPQGLQLCRDVLDAYDIDLVHQDVLLSAPLVVAAHERRIPILAHVRTIVGRQERLPELVHFVDRALTISDFVTDSLKATLIDRSRITQLYDPIDLAACDPTRYDRAVLRDAAGISASAQVITMVGRLHELKRQHLLIRALELLRDTHPRALVLIVGEPDGAQRSYAAGLRALAAEREVTSRVRFDGYEPDVPKVYAMSDILVMCMTEEGWGRVTVEAMAMGVPVVAPRAGGSLEIVTDGHDGLTFEPDNVDDLALALRRLLDDDALARRLAAAGRIRARQFDVPAHVKSVTAVYRELLVQRSQQDQRDQDAGLAAIAPGARVAEASS